MSYVQVTLSKLKIWDNKIVIACMQMTMPKKPTRSSQTKQKHLMLHPLKDSLFKGCVLVRLRDFFNPTHCGRVLKNPTQLNSSHEFNPLRSVRAMSWTIFKKKKIEQH